MLVSRKKVSGPNKFRADHKGREQDRVLVSAMFAHYGATLWSELFGERLCKSRVEIVSSERREGTSGNLFTILKVWSCLFCRFAPSPSSVHNLAMTLSWTKFDGKIMIYIEFCIRKSILKFLGVSYFWGQAPKLQFQHVS